jgi:hypothetical protein
MNHEFVIVAVMVRQAHHERLFYYPSFVIPIFRDDTFPQGKANNLSYLLIVMPEFVKNERSPDESGFRSGLPELNIRGRG